MPAELKMIYIRFLFHSGRTGISDCYYTGINCRMQESQQSAHSQYMKIRNFYDFG
jgi:hypothetical protein